jgi:hypothetical protein
MNVMMDTPSRLELTAREIELIETALHTQEKILSVQSEAGGTGAGTKLAELSRLARRIGRARRTAHPECSPSLGQMFRNLFGRESRCTQNG